MNSLSPLSSIGPSLLAATTGAVGAAGAAAAARSASSWLDEGTQGPSEVLHVGPNSRPRALDDIARDFLQALCVVGPDKAV